MTKIISIGIIIILAWVGWKVYEQWEDVRSKQDLTQQEAERARQAVAAINPESLPGMPQKQSQQMEASLREAQRQGAAGIREWLKRYRKVVQDPRLAWIELDYVVLIAHDNPQEAKRIFAEVKERTPPTSQIFDRIKQLEKTYE